MCGSDVREPKVFEGSIELSAALRSVGNQKIIIKD